MRIWHVSLCTKLTVPLNLWAYTRFLSVMGLWITFSWLNKAMTVFVPLALRHLQETFTNPRSSFCSSFSKKILNRYRIRMSWSAILNALINHWFPLLPRSIFKCNPIYFLYQNLKLLKDKFFSVKFIILLFSILSFLIGGSCRPNGSSRLCRRSLPNDEAFFWFHIHEALVGNAFHRAGG